MRKKKSPERHNKSQRSKDTSIAYFFLKLDRFLLIYLHVLSRGRGITLSAAILTKLQTCYFFFENHKCKLSFIFEHTPISYYLFQTSNCKCEYFVTRNLNLSFEHILNISGTTNPGHGTESGEEDSQEEFGDPLLR